MGSSTGTSVRPYRVLLLGARRRITFARKLRLAGTALGVPIELFGSDTDRLDPLSHFCDDFFILPKCGAADFHPSLMAEITAREIDLVIPWNDEDIARLDSVLGEDAELRHPFVLPPRHVTRLCLDKRALSVWCAANGIRHPKLFSAESVEFPCVVKPVQGQGSVGVVICNNDVDFRYALQLNEGKDVLIQQYIGGPEYTVDLFAWPVARVFSAVPRQRIKTRGGEVLIAKTAMDRKVLEFVDVLTKRLEFCGMLNCQLIVDEAGVPVLIELNPRFGGGVDLSIECGADFPRYILEYALNGRLGVAPPEIRDGVIMTRYHESIFVEPPAENKAQFDSSKAS